MSVALLLPFLTLFWRKVTIALPNRFVFVTVVAKHKAFAQVSYYSVNRRSGHAKFGRGKTREVLQGCLIVWVCDLTEIDEEARYQDRSNSTSEWGVEINNDDARRV